MESVICVLSTPGHEVPDGAATTEALDVVADVDAVEGGGTVTEVSEVDIEPDVETAPPTRTAALLELL